MGWSFTRKKEPKGSTPEQTGSVKTQPLSPEKPLKQGGLLSKIFRRGLSSADAGALDTQDNPYQMSDDSLDTVGALLAENQVQKEVKPVPIPQNPYRTSLSLEDMPDYKPEAIDTQLGKAEFSPSLWTFKQTENNFSDAKEIADFTHQQQTVPVTTMNDDNYGLQFEPDHRVMTLVSPLDNHDLKRLIEQGILSFVTTHSVFSIEQHPVIMPIAIVTESENYLSDIFLNETGQIDKQATATTEAMTHILDSLYQNNPVETYDNKRYENKKIRHAVANAAANHFQAGSNPFMASHSFLAKAATEHEPILTAEKDVYRALLHPEAPAYLQSKIQQALDSLPEQSLKIEPLEEQGYRQQSESYITETSTTEDSADLEILFATATETSVLSTGDDEILVTQSPDHDYFFSPKHQFSVASLDEENGRDEGYEGDLIPPEAGFSENVPYLALETSLLKAESFNTLPEPLFPEPLLYVDEDPAPVQTWETITEAENMVAYVPDTLFFQFENTIADIDAPVSLDLDEPPEIYGLENYLDLSIVEAQKPEEEIIFELEQVEAPTECYVQAALEYEVSRVEDIPSEPFTSVTSETTLPAECAHLAIEECLKPPTTEELRSGHGIMELESETETPQPEPDLGTSAQEPLMMEEAQAFQKPVDYLVNHQDSFMEVASAEVVLPVRKPQYKIDTAELQALFQSTEMAAIDELPLYEQMSQFNSQIMRDKNRFLNKSINQLVERYFLKP